MEATLGAFVNWRVGELDLMRVNWRLLQRALNDEQIKKFEAMIKTPGFCVSKFEEKYVLRNINPFAKNDDEKQIIRSSHVNCGCAASEEVYKVLEIKQQLSELLEKWGNIFKNLPPEAFKHISKTLLEVGDLQEETITQLMTIEKKQSEMKAQEVNPVENVVVEKKPKKSKKQKSNAVAEQCVWNVAHVSGQPVHPKEVPQEVSSASIVLNPVQDEPTIIIEPEAPIVVQPESVEKVESTDDVTATSLVSPAEEPISIACTEETASLPSPVQDVFSPAITENGITDNGRATGTPDSGMISDISEFKVSGKKDEKPKDKDPEKMTGRDGRRYRHKLREAEKLSEEQARKSEERREDDVPERKVSTESEPTVLSGKEKRRLKDKLRKEKKEQEKLMVSTNDAPSTESKSEPSSNEEQPAVVENNDVVEKEREEEKEGEKEEKKEQEKEEKGEIGEKKEVDEPGLGVVGLFEEQPDEQPSLGVVEQDEKFSQEVSTDDQNAVKKLSKSQKRRANKKANKGVYVVNDNGSHSIELLPGEYRIVQLDQNRKIEEVPIKILPGKEISIDDVLQNKQVESSSNDKKRKKNIVNSNMSQKILDKGKWLAYVVDDNNPDGMPRVGEVNNEEVEKTIQLLGSQMAQAEREQENNSYVDDYDFTNEQATNFVKQILPELDAEYVRKMFEKIEKDEDYAGEALCDPIIEGSNDPNSDDLSIYLNAEDDSNIEFITEFARQTAPVFVGNTEFKEFCQKYSNSKYNPSTIHTLIKKYIDMRIVFHYERFKKLADYEARRISKCWTRVTENSKYALMVMLFINNPKTNTGFEDIENVLFAIQ